MWGGTYVSVCLHVPTSLCVPVDILSYEPVFLYVPMYPRTSLCVHVCMRICVPMRACAQGAPGLVYVNGNVREWGWGMSRETVFLEAMPDQLPSYLYCHVNQIFSASLPRSLRALSPPGREPQTRLANR